MGRPYLVQRPLLDVAQDEIGNHSHIGKKGIFDYGGGGGGKNTQNIDYKICERSLGDPLKNLI